MPQRKLLEERRRCPIEQWAAKPFTSAGLDEVSRGWSFTVPSGCAAQWLELSGIAGDVAQQADVTITNPDGTSRPAYTSFRDARTSGALP